MRRTGEWDKAAVDRCSVYVQAVHRAYFEAGADVATTASYQASVRGFLDAGYTREQAEELMRRSVRLACEARDEFGKGLVALSMGCYGAVLANGAEYTGEYGSATLPDLVRFHKERLDILLQGTFYTHGYCRSKTLRRIFRSCRTWYRFHPFWDHPLVCGSTSYPWTCDYWRQETYPAGGSFVFVSL